MLSHKTININGIFWGALLSIILFNSSDVFAQDDSLVTHEYSATGYGNKSKSWQVDFSRGAWEEVGVYNGRWDVFNLPEMPEMFSFTGQLTFGYSLLYSFFTSWLMFLLVAVWVFFARYLYATIKL